MIALAIALLPAWQGAAITSGSMEPGIRAGDFVLVNRAPELIREGQVGDTLAVISTDNGSKTDIPAWVDKAGHRLVGVYDHDGYDEIVVEKLK